MMKPKQPLPKHALIIPHGDLNPETLRAVIEQFVSRDGPDSGHIETELEHKIAQVLSALANGKAVLVYDRREQTCNIMSSDDMNK